MVDEDLAKATITKKGSSQVSNSSRCQNPARRFEIKFTKLLKLTILCFRQELNSHAVCHFDRTGFGLVFFPRFQPLIVIANRDSAFWALGRAIHEYKFTCVFVITHDIWLAARLIHLIKRPKFARMGVEFSF